MAFPRDSALHSELARRGGKKGGATRARNLSPEQRSAIARMGAMAANRNRKLKKRERISA